MKVKKLLALVVIATIIVLSNNKIYAQNFLEESVQITKRYDGQKGYGSSGIINCETYLKHKHKSNVVLTSSKNIELINIPQIEFSNGNMEGNCCIAAITRLINYYSINKEIEIEDKNAEEIYNSVREIAVNKYNYVPEKGLKVMYIKSLIEDVFKYYNYKVEVKLKLATWNFIEYIKTEIDNNKPVIIANANGFGYYRNHALSICGYEKYNVSKKILLWKYDKEYPMIEVCDGWSYKTKYIDYNQFKRELQNLTSTIFTVSIGENIGGET